MNLTEPPGALACAECGDDIADAGYLPAERAGDAYDPMPDAAVCTACGFNEVGFQGCAPEPGDVVDADADTVLLQVRVAEDGVEVVDAKE